MDSNWQKLLAKKQRAVAHANSKPGQGKLSQKRKRGDVDTTSPSAAGHLERPSQRVKQHHQHMLPPERPIAPPPRNAFKGFIPVFDEDEEKHPQVPVPVDAAAEVLSLDLKIADGSLTRVLAMDCEMVGVGGGEDGDGERSVIARVSIVNYAGQVVYDRYVRPEEPVTSYRTAVSGILPHHIHGSHAVAFAQSVKEVETILRNRVLVGHAVHHDLKALMIGHPREEIRDTSRYKIFCPFGPKALKKLCQEVLGLEIQTGQHDSVEDARAALALYKHAAAAWEATLRRKIHKSKSRRVSSSSSSSSSVPPSDAVRLDSKASKGRKQQPQQQKQQQPRRPVTPAADAIHPFA